MSAKLYAVVFGIFPRGRHGTQTQVLLVGVAICVTTRDSANFSHVLDRTDAAPPRAWQVDALDKRVATPVILGVIAMSKDAIADGSETGGAFVNIPFALRALPSVCAGAVVSIVANAVPTVSAMEAWPRCTLIDVVFAILTFPAGRTGAEVFVHAVRAR